MRILMISGDPKIMDPHSGVRKRILEYASLFDHLHIFLICKNGGYENHKINEKLSLTTFSSAFKLPGIFNAISEARGHIGKFEYVTTQDPFELGLTGFIISKILKIKLQLQIHTDVGSRYFIYQNPLNFFRYFIYRFLIGRADSIRVVSRRVEREVLRRKVSGRIFVLPIFVDIEKLEEQKTNFDIKEKYTNLDQVILMVSRLTTEKDYNTALKAFEIIYNKYPKAGLVIVGDGPKRNHIKNIANRLGIADRVYFEGFSEDVSSYMNTSDIYLLTSKYEGYSMSLIEAASHRIPIISTDVGIIGDYLIKDHSVLVCPVKNARCLADKMIILMENKDLAYSLYMEAARSVTQKALTKYNYLEKFKETFI